MQSRFTLRRDHIADLTRAIGAATAQPLLKGTTMNPVSLLDIRSLADVRAFLSTALPGLASVLVIAGTLTADVANLWTAFVLVVIHAGVSTFNTANGFRKFLYPFLAAGSALLIRYGYTTDETWALWFSIVPILFGGGVAAANTPTTPATDTRLAA